MIHRLAPRADSLLGQLGSRYLRWQLTASRLWMLALFAIPLSARGLEWRWLWPTMLSIPVYLYLHWQVYADAMRRQPWYCAGMVALGFAVCPYNGVALGYAISGCVCFAYQPSWRRWLAFVALAAAPAVMVALWLDVSWWLTLLLLAITLLSGFGQHLHMANLRKDVALRLSQEEVRRLAVLAERERIGRDLHDLLGHTLSLVTLKSELARRLALADPARAQREMEEVERVSRHALAEVRAAVSGMRRSDLGAELVSARLMLEASGIVFVAESPEAPALPPEVEAPLALVLREAVTNIHRHARATAASVRLGVTTEGFEMRISDNGRGGLAAHGNGVSGMRERVRGLGGTLAIDSPAGRGTCVEVKVPLAAASRATTAPAPVAAALDRARGAA
jgi:two-component system sensor histidine kinase DesK